MKKLDSAELLYNCINTVWWILLCFRIHGPARFGVGTARNDRRSVVVLHSWRVCVYFFFCLARVRVEIFTEIVKKNSRHFKTRFTGIFAGNRFPLAVMFLRISIQGIRFPSVSYALRRRSPLTSRCSSFTYFFFFFYVSKNALSDGNRYLVENSGETDGILLSRPSASSFHSGIVIVVYAGRKIPRPVYLYSRCLVAPVPSSALFRHSINPA